MNNYGLMAQSQWSLTFEVRKSAPDMLRHAAAKESQ